MKRKLILASLVMGLTITSIDSSAYATELGDASNVETAIVAETASDAETASVAETASDVETTSETETQIDTDQGVEDGFQPPVATDNDSASAGDLVEVSNHIDASTRLNVDTHSQEEIATYLKNNASAIQNAFVTTYAELPSSTAPYNIGRLSDTTLNGALAQVNAIRYIAGIPYNVTLSEERVQLAQAATVVNAANDALSHYPTQPSGMSDTIFNLGYEGASHSNLGWGYGTLGYVIKSGFMGDSDSYNIAMLGHRRWILNPPMASTGFGQTGTFTAMHTIGSEWYNSTSYNRVAWPAQNTPCDYFATEDAWSLSMGSSVNASSVNVTLTNKKNGSVYTFSSSSANGYFNVNNDNYGQPGCIIFRPSAGTDVTAGSSYHVTVNGNYTSGSSFTVEYDVNFFDINNVGSSSNSSSSTSTEDVMTKYNQTNAFITNAYLIFLGRPTDEEGRVHWLNGLMSGELDGASFLCGIFFSEEFQSLDYDNDTFVKKMYKGMFNRDWDVSGYNDWMSQLEAGADRFVVIRGFVMSNEYFKMCAAYDIDPGNFDSIRQYGGNSSSATEETTEAATEAVEGETTASGLRKVFKPYGEAHVSTSEPSRSVDPTSEEYALTSEFVKRFYTKGLLRNYDPDGLEDWTSGLQDGSYTAANIAVGFFHSPEFLGFETTDEDFVERLYQVYLNRDSDPNGKADYLNELSMGYSRDYVMYRFIYSPEFGGLCKEYGIDLGEYYVY